MLGIIYLALITFGSMVVLGLCGLAAEKLWQDIFKICLARTTRRSRCHARPVGCARPTNRRGNGPHGDLTIDSAGAIINGIRMRLIAFAEK